MPRETYETTTRGIAMDALAQSRAMALVPIVQESYNAYELAKYGSNDPPDIDEAYVRTHAIRVGLNRFPLVSMSRVNAPTAATFAVQAGTDVEAVAVDVVNEDLTRAQAWATALSVNVSLVLSAALCTGLGALSGDPVAGLIPPLPALGPFVAPPS